MNLRSLRIRTLSIITMLAVVLASFAGYLFNRQVVHGAEYSGMNAVTTGTAPIAAARGIILDRNGVPMVLNRSTISMVFEHPFFPTDKVQRAEMLSSLISLFEEHAAEWIDMLPIVLDGDGVAQFVEGRDSDIAKMKADFLKLNEYATAQNCLDALVEEYQLQSYSLVAARKIASVQYNMWRSDYRMGIPYTFAKNVTEDLKSRVSENNSFYQGIRAEMVPERAYADGTVAPHVVGRVAGITSEDYQKHKGTDNAYRITDEYGAFGIERVAQEDLRGRTGTKRILVDSATGKATEEIEQPAVQGNTVILTIDSALQQLIETNFPKHLDALSARRYAGVPAAGAVVVIDVRNFEILASVSYPGYDISDYQMNFTAWSSDETAPLWNRVLQGTYEPGSTSKVSVALAALQEDLIDESYYQRCTGTYPYLDMTFKCPQVGLHGGKPVNVVRALVDSCNSFFYEMGKRLGYKKINEYRLSMGLGNSTGIELPEATGVMESKEYRESKGETWYAGNNLQTAIGQGNLFTPMQLAVYAATIANNGTRYEAHYIQSVRKAGTNELVRSNAAKILGTTGIEAHNYDIVKRAMLELGTSTATTAGRYLRDLPVQVAAKTGTSQVTRKIDGEWQKINNGIFISFAPYDNPEIAVIAVGEGCKSSEPVIPTVRDIYDYYFSSLNQMQLPQPENTPLG